MNLGQENEVTEWKESLAQLDKGLKSMTAMLNKHGEATVYFGVSDDGEIKGVELGKHSLESIRERISATVEPQPHYEIETRKSEDGKDYLVLKAKGNETPYSFDGRYFIRNVSSDERMDHSALRRAIVGGRFDALRETRSRKQKLTFEILYAYFAANGIHVREGETILGNYGVLNAEGSYNDVAYLLSDKNEVSIKVVKFEGLNKSSMSSRTELGYRSLLSSCQGVLDYVKATNVTMVDLSEGKRKEMPLFDFEAFREAWINAVLHNEWLRGIPPSVFLFDDRIEVLSYGSLPFNMSEEDFYAGKSRPVNRSLFEIFALSSLAEQSGHGVPLIVDRCGKKAFDFSSGTIVVTIPFAFVPEPIKIQRYFSAKGPTGREIENQVLLFFLEQSTASMRECASSLGVSESYVKKTVESLRMQGKLKRYGSRKGGSWIV